MRDNSVNNKPDTKLTEILERFKVALDLNETIKICDSECQTSQGFTKLEQDLYSYRSFRIKLGLRIHSEVETDNLLLANKLNIRSAPILIQHIIVGEGESVLVTKIDGVEDSILLPYSKSSCSEESKERFLEDMELLMLSGFVHSDILRDTSAWLVAPTTGNIILTSWERLKEVRQDEIENVLKYLRNLLDA